MMKRYHFYMITLLAVFTLFSLITMKVNGQGENTVAVERELYEELEEDYTQRLQEMLESKGYRNAGITMTKIYQEDGSRDIPFKYTTSGLTVWMQEKKSYY